LRLKRRETEEDSVSCPMKYSNDVECRSDSLAVISYRDINQFTYVNLSYDKWLLALNKRRRTLSLEEGSELPYNADQAVSYSA
jgi:hypothetical protein